MSSGMHVVSLVQISFGEKKGEYALPVTALTRHFAEKLLVLELP